MLAPPSRLAAKAAAGAEVVLTQPPLLWDRSERWAHAAHDAGLTGQVRVVVGVAMASSASNLDFWLRLAGVRGLPEAEALLASFPTPGGGMGKEGCAAAVRAWNVDLIRKVREEAVGRGAALPAGRRRDAACSWVAGAPVPSSLPACPCRRGRCRGWRGCT